MGCEYLAPSKGSSIQDVRSTLGSQATSREIVLEQLCRLHWKTLYLFARSGGKGHADAEDLTQEFLSDFFRRKLYAKYCPALGNLKAFLIALFRNFLIDKYRALSAQKRGGRSVHVTFDFCDELEIESLNANTTNDNLAKTIDREWAGKIFGRATKRLASDYASKKQTALFEIIRGFILGGVADGMHQEIGERLGMSEAAIRNAVYRMRRKFRAYLRQEIASLSDGDAGSAEQLHYLIDLLVTKEFASVEVAESETRGKNSLPLALPAG
jgi:RNA polymerase sigma factor (sigma-70 family)